MSEPEPRAHAPRLPDFFTTPIPDAPPHPDARLLELAELALASLLRHRDLMRDYRAHFTTTMLRPASRPAAADLHRIFGEAKVAFGVAAPLLREASKLRATTPEGIMAKALMMRASRTGAPVLARSLAFDLLGSATLRAAVWPATTEEG